MLEARDLRKSYQDATAVEAFSHRFAEGKITTVLGPSGSGKSTTLGMITGLIEPDAGTISLEGKDITALAPEKRGFGMVFQNYALFPHLTARENVEFGLRVRGVAKAERRRRAEEMLELARIGSLGARRIHELSGGEQQRVALARALAFRPKVLLMDEPLSALDAKLREELRADLATLLRDVAVTTIYVTHDQAEAMSLGHELIVMNRGRIEQSGAPVDLYRRPATPFVAAFLGSANLFEAECDGASAHLPMTVSAAPAGAKPGPCWALIRPEDLHADAAGFPATVETTFFVGHRVRVHLQAGEVKLVMDAPNDLALAPGDVIHLRLDAAKLHLWPRS